MKKTISVVSLLFLTVNLCFSQVDFKAWAKTPPMGWNSWDCYGASVTEKEIRENADYMAANLKKSGWQYIVVDIRWFTANPWKGNNYNFDDPGYSLDEYGRFVPDTKRFPSAANNTGFKVLADYVHRLGLKFGIHIMRGVPVKAVENKLPVKDAPGITADMIYTRENQCKWLRDMFGVVAGKPGAQEYYNSLMELYASWGVDFIKVDDLSAPIYHQQEVELIRKAIDRSGRKIVLSTSPGETPAASAAHVSEYANMWRMVNDVWDKWSHIVKLFKYSQDWYPYIKTGTWPDCDMIPLGRISLRGPEGQPRNSLLTKDEQYTLMTLFSIFKSPLMFGGNLPDLDSFTLSLLTNKEVLKMHRTSTDVKQVFQTKQAVAIASKGQSKLSYLALFNIDNAVSQDIKINLQDLGIQKPVTVTELWSGRKLGTFTKEFSQTLVPHQSGLYMLKE